MVSVVLANTEGGCKTYFKAIPAIRAGPYGASQPRSGSALQSNGLSTSASRLAVLSRMLSAVLLTLDRV